MSPLLSIPDSTDRADAIGRLAQVVLLTRRIAEGLELAPERTDSVEAGVESIQLNSMLRFMVESHSHDRDAGMHLLRVSRMSEVVSLALSLGRSEVQQIAAAAPMHDIGKVGIPQSLLRKQGPLTPDERRIMQHHTVLGGDLLGPARSPVLTLARTIAVTHHERWDGSGYPRGLRGRQIPVAGRVVMICDQYDALRSQRPYKPRLPHDRVCEILLCGDGRTMPGHFDPDILAAFRSVEGEMARVYSELTDLDSLRAALEQEVS